jgi:hypothetical protein
MVLYPDFQPGGKVSESVTKRLEKRICFCQLYFFLFFSPLASSLLCISGEEDNPFNYQQQKIACF